MSDDVRLGLVVGGIALVVVALAWWWGTRTRRKARLVRQLRATDPQERARAGIRLIDLGLVRAARPILDHVATEQDARVRLALALAVARRQWEPSNASKVARVREWASGELERQGRPVSPFGPAVTRISDMGGPRPADQAASPAPDAPPPPEEATAPPIHWQPGGSP
jgi:hypothetical protein